MKECYYCKSTPIMEWADSYCFATKRKLTRYYARCPKGCVLGEVHDTPTEASDAWDRHMDELPSIVAARERREKEIVKRAVDHGYRFWHIVGPDGFEFDLWLKSKSDLITEDMRAMYHQRGFARISLADFTLTDNTEKELA